MTEPVFEQAGGPSPDVKAEVDYFRHGRSPARYYISSINVSTRRHRNWTPVAWMAGVAVLDVLTFPLAAMFFKSDLVANADLSGSYLQKLGDTLVGLAALGIMVGYAASFLMIVFELVMWVDDQ